MTLSEQMKAQRKQNNQINTQAIQRIQPKLSEQLKAERTLTAQKQPIQRQVNPAANILQNATKVQSYNDVVPQKEKPQFKNTSFIDTSTMEQKPQTTEWNESTRQALDRKDSLVLNREGSPILNFVVDALKTGGINAVAGMADIIDAGYAGGTKISGLDASTINAENLIRYSKGDKGGFLETTGDFLGDLGTGIIPGLSLVKNAKGWGQRPSESYSKLRDLHLLYPNNVDLNNLYTQITNGTYSGTQKELEKTLSDIQIQIATGFKAKYTDDDRARAEKQATTNKEKYGTFGDIVLNKGIGTASRMTPTILASTAFGPATGTTAIGLQAGGSAYSQALDEGATFNDAFNYGVASGVAEATIEKIGGDTVNKFLLGGKTKTLTGDWVDDFIKSKGINNTFTKVALTTLNDIGGEAVEEGISAAIEPVIAEITYNPDKDFNLKEYGSSIVTAMIESIPATLFMGGAGKVQTINAVNKYETGLINEINKSTLTDTQKAELIKGVQEKCKDARIGLETNFEEIQAEVTQKLQKNPANILQNATQTQTYDEAMQNNVQNAPQTENISQNNVENAQNLQNANQKISIKERDMNLFKRIYKNAFNENGQLKPFKQQLKDFFDGKTYKGEKLIVMPNNEGLEYADVRNAPLEITQHAILAHSSDAKTRTLENLPEELKNSPLALDSISRPELNARVFVLNQQEEGQPLIATIHQKDGKAEIEVNKLSSIYGKNDIQGFINETVKKGGKIYKNKRTDDWLTFSGLQLPEDINSKSSILNNIIPPNENYVNIQENLMPTTDQLQAQDQKQAEEAYNTLNMKKPKLEQIAELTEEQAQLPKIKYKQKADKKNSPNRSKFFENVETSKIISQNVKDRIDVKNYERKANLATLEKVTNKLDENPMKIVSEWQNKKKNYTDEDVALGAILMERLQAEGRFEEAVDVVYKLVDMAPDVGRAVQMYSIFQRLTPEGMMIYQQRKLSSALETLTQKQTGKWVEQNKDKFKLTEDDATFITAKVQEAQNAPTERQKQIALAEIETRINDKLPPEAGQSVKAFRRIAMLFNPKTQVRNVVGNITVMPLNYVTDLVATQIDKIVAKKTGVRTTAGPNIKTIAKGFKKGAMETIDDYRRGIRTTPTGSRYEIQNNAKSFNENTNSKVRNFINNKLNGLDRILSTVLELGDRPFYEAAYQNALEAQMKANNVTEPTQEMIDIASNVALSQTWQDNNDYTRAVLGARTMLNKLSNAILHTDKIGVGLGDLVIPFAKTPANFTKAIIEYSPLGTIEALVNYNDMQKAISRGDMTPMQQKKFVTSVGKAAAGTILYAIAGALVKGGKITGSNDEDKDVANFEKNVLGIQPYSIKIGDKTFTYNWANPIATPLAIMADTYKMSEDGAKWNEILINGFKVAGDQLVANSFLQGIQELLSSEYGNESAMDNLVGAIMDLPTQFTPTLLGQIATQFDKTKRQTFESGDSVGTMVNEVKNKIPGAKNTLAPQVNTFGEEIQNYGGANNPFNVFLNPGNVSSTNASDTQKELYALYEVTKDKTIFPRQAPYTVEGGGESFKLSSQDRADYQKTSGQYVTEQLDALFDSRFYQSLENDEKADVVAKIVEDADLIAKDKWIDTKSTERIAKIQTELQENDIPIIAYYNAWASIQGVEGKKNWKGETISGSKKKNQITEINKAVGNDLTAKQKETLYGILNISGY